MITKTILNRGAKVVTTRYAEVDFDVNIEPLFQTPEEATITILEILLGNDA